MNQRVRLTVWLGRIAGTDIGLSYADTPVIA